MDNWYAFYPPDEAPGGEVTSLNGETGDITLVAGTGITITPSGQDITIAATGGSGAMEVEYRTISSGEGTSKSLVLAMAPSTPTLVILGIAGAPTQVYGTDFTVSGSTLSWSGTALDGILTTGDQILLQYNV